MRRFTSIACGMLTLAVLPAIVAAHDHGAGKQQSWQGEIVDLACELPEGARGTDHAECAKKCLKAGEPMGLLLADGDILLLMADHDDAAPFEAAKELAGQQVEVSGSLAERGGMRAITLASVKPAT